MAAIKHIDMYKDFLALVRKSRVGTVSPIEFTTFYNLATEEVISQMLEVMDLNKKFMNALLPLRVVSNQLPITMDTTISTRYKSGTVDLPAAHRRMSRVVTIISTTVGAVNTVNEAKTNLIKSNEVSSIVDGIYSKPTTKNCYYHMERKNTTDKVKIYVPYLTTYTKEYPKCILEYYASPAIVAVADVTVDDNTKVSVFNKETCTMIINSAARMYLENVQDARYQTYNNELKQKN